MTYALGYLLGICAAAVLGAISLRLYDNQKRVHDMRLYLAKTTPWQSR